MVSFLPDSIECRILVQSRRSVILTFFAIDLYDPVGQPFSKCPPHDIATKKKIKACIFTPFPLFTLFPSYFKTKLHGWHYGKGLIYYRPIFRLTKLAFLRAIAIPRENIF